MKYQIAVTLEIDAASDDDAKTAAQAALMGAGSIDSTSASVRLSNSGGQLVYATPSQ